MSGNMSPGGIHGPVKNPSFDSLKLSINTETLTGNKTLVTTDKAVQWLDPGGTSRNVILPAEASSTDSRRYIYNDSDGAGENLTLKNDAAATIATLGPGMLGILGCNGTDWKWENDSGLYHDAISGHSGMGTTNSGSKLELHSLSTSELKMFSDTDDNAVNDVRFVIGTGGVTGQWTFGLDASNSNAFILANSNGDLNSNQRIVVQTGGNVGIGTINPDRKLHTKYASALTNTVQQVTRLTHITSDTPANNIGVGLEFEQETSIDNNEVIAIIEAVVTDVTGTSEDADLVIKTMSGGAAAAECARFSKNGISFFATAIQAQQAHIVDADGSIGDITTKFNTLLADLEGYGLLATS